MASVENVSMMSLDPFNPSLVFSFEKHFDEASFLSWMNQNWTMSFWYSAAYILFIFGGKHYMDKRPKFDLRIALAVWSGVLAVFSIFGAIRTIPELVHAISKNGWEYSMCNPSYFYGSTGFWAFMFTISKAYELGDTVFIILRKQPLIFLHWYHHITVMIYVWYSYTDHTAPGRWFMVMNYTVHSVMYTYYCLRAMRVPIPKQISMCITTMQICQMIYGLVVNIWIYYIKERGDYCQQTYENLRYCLIMYLSYFVLFGHFFYKAYVRDKKKHIAPKPLPPKKEKVMPVKLD